MIAPSYVRTMAIYNSAMNYRLYEAAGTMTDAERRLARGAFWGSIHGTFAHLLWGDRMWMSRFDGWEKPEVTMTESTGLIAEFGALRTARSEADRKIEQWAATVDADWLAADQTWYSGAAQRELHMPRGLLVTHFFNHQTHHRGQIHAMLTAAGRKTDDTDLFLVVPTPIA